MISVPSAAPEQVLRAEALKRAPVVRPITVRRLEVLAKSCATGVMFLGVLSILGWLVSWPELTSLGNRYVPTAPATGLALVVLGASLWLQVRKEGDAPSRILGLAGIMVPAVIGFVSLIEWRIVPEPPPNDSLANFVGGVSPLSAIGLTIFSVVFFLLKGASAISISISAQISFAMCFGSFAVLLGYAYGTPLLYGGVIRPVGFTSAAAFLILSVGVMAAAGPSCFPLRYLLGPSVRARMLRVFVPVTFAVVLVGELASDVLRWKPVTNPALQGALQTLFAASLISLVVSHVANWLGKLIDGAQRRQLEAEEALRRAYSELEQRIQERTAELGRINQNLVTEMAAREMAQQAAEQLAQIVESSSDAIIGVSVRGEITSWNPGAERLLGYRPGQALGLTIDKLVCPDRGGECQHLIERAASTATIALLETAWQNRAGGRISISLSVSPLIGPTGAIVGASLIGRDITEQKRLEREIIDISAREQQRIGQDLHDGIGQKLTGAAFHARALEHRLALRSSADAREASLIVEILNEAVSHTQHLARSLFPIDLEHLGIGAALQHLASTFELQHGLPCVALVSDGQCRGDSEVQRQLYLIAHEAAHNAVKHAAARQVIISFEIEAERTILRVHDDGQGFSEVEKSPSGMGLWIMRYRARQIGANLSIQSDPSSGTTVTCTLPASRTD